MREGGSRRGCPWLYSVCTSPQLLERGRLDDFIGTVAGAIMDYCEERQCQVARADGGRGRR